MSLRDEVADFLLSDEPHIRTAMERLNFFVEDFHVEPEGYREIGHKIKQGAVTVSQGTRIRGSQTSAVYTPRLDQLSVSSANMDLLGTSPQAISQQTEIVHEVTHAVMDYHRYQATSVVQEIAAYVAGGLYARGHFLPLNSDYEESQAILRAATGIIDSRNMITSREERLRLGDSDVAELAQAIRGHQSYPNADDVFPSDGISGGLINPWYLPRYPLGHQASVSISRELINPWTRPCDGLISQPSDGVRSRLQRPPGTIRT